ncbi:hypothetical protein FHG87_016477 [Trinorchestia longiramus]|nr:hypothetical protein FHG87_016477 [Trinorchestia longiramus]
MPNKCVVVNCRGNYNKENMHRTVSSMCLLRVCPLQNSHLARRKLKTNNWAHTSACVDTEKEKQLIFLTCQLELLLQKQFSMNDYCFALQSYPKCNYEQLRDFLVLPCKRKLQCITSFIDKDQVLRETFDKVQALQQKKVFLSIITSIIIRLPKSNAVILASSTMAAAGFEPGSFHSQADSITSRPSWPYSNGTDTQIQREREREREKEREKEREREREREIPSRLYM